MLIGLLKVITKYTHYLHYDSAYPKSRKNNVSYNIAKKIIAFVSDDKEVYLWWNKLRNWLKNTKYPDIKYPDDRY